MTCSSSPHGQTKTSFTLDERAAVERRVTVKTTGRLALAGARAPRGSTANARLARLIRADLDGPSPLASGSTPTISISAPATPVHLDRLKRRGSGLHIGEADRIGVAHAAVLEASR